MRRIRRTLFIITTVLLCFGLVMVYSSSSIYAYEKLGDSSYFLKRHILYMGLGLLASVFVMAIGDQRLKEYSRPILLLGLLFLALVLVPGLGTKAGGARRWFRFLGFSLQPAEFVKLTLIIYLAEFLSRKQFRITDFLYGFLAPTIVVGVAVILVLLQPDLGTAIAILVVALILYFASGVRVTHMLSIFLASIPALYFLIFRVPYRRRRIAVFLNPWLDPKGTGFQMVQSFIALGSGGLLGVGLGQSRQKLFYLPASHTDFIFSIIGEELGLMGTVCVTILFILFIWEGMKIALSSPDLFGQLLSLGIVSKIALEAIVNIGVATGTLPTKGLPLPFISYGGSALISNMVGVALLLSVARERK